MKKTLQDYQGRALKNLEKIKSSGSTARIDHDKVSRPKHGKINQLKSKEARPIPGFLKFKTIK